MNDIRKIKLIVNGRMQKDGAGVRLQRVLSNRNVYDFDPFLMLDFFDSTNPEDYIKGFPWHPHRGIETITYLITGKIEHMDSLGNKGVIYDNYCQWMTAGSGIMHQEMPIASEYMLGFQLWLNLPQKDKMCKPAYNDIDKNKIPLITEEDKTIHLISGRYKDIYAPVQGDYVKADILDVELNAGKVFEYDTITDNTVFIFILRGIAVFEYDDFQEITSGNAVLFDKGERIIIKPKDNNLRFIIFSAKALNESIAWGGPIVMNTHEELDIAFSELEKGTFIK